MSIRVKSILAVLFLFLFSAQAYATPLLLQQTLDALHIGGAQSVPPPASVEIAFSPDGGAENLVIKTIQSAKQSIRVAAYSFTSHPIAQALIEAHKAGIAVQIVIDHEQVEKHNYSLAGYLVEQGVPLRVDIIHALQHDKYMVIDNKTVETGSFNYTAAAEHYNSENVVVLRDAPQLASTYAENWQNLWDKAESYGGQ